MKWFYKIYYNSRNDGPPYNDAWSYYGHSQNKSLIKDFISQRNMGLYKIRKYPIDEMMDHLPNGYKEDEELRLIPIQINEYHDMMLISMTMWEYRDLCIDYSFPDILFDPSLAAGMSWFPDWKRMKREMRDSLDILLYTSIYEDQKSLPDDEVDLLASYYHTPLGRHLATKVDVFNVLKEEKFFRFSKNFNRFYFDRII